MKEILLEFYMASNMHNSDEAKTTLACKHVKQMFLFQTIAQH